MTQTEREMQRQALLILFQQLTSASTLPQEESTLPGVTCNAKGHVTRLDFENYDIKVVPKHVLASFPYLRELELSHTNLEEPPDVSYNQKLSWLNLWHTKIRKAPDVSKNPNLQMLNVSCVNLIQPPDITKNLNLIKLVLEDTKLTPEAKAQLEEQAEKQIFELFWESL